LKKKNTYILTNLLILGFLCILIILIGRSSILKKENQLLKERYTGISQNFQDKINSLIQTKKTATLAITLTLAEDERIKDILLINKDSDYKLDALSEKIRKYTDFKNVWFHVINKEGYSVYRSWTDNKNDRIKDSRLDLPELLKNPTVKNTISVGIYDITFKSIVPLYKDGVFIGILEGITHFNSITRDLRNNYGIEPIILVNNIFTKQLKENNFSKIFLKDYYVANLSVSSELLDYLNTQDIKSFLDIKDCLIKDGKLITNIPIVENGVKLANILVFKDLNQIDISEISEFKKHAFLYLSFFLIFFCLSIFIIGYYLYSKRLKELNYILQKTVNEEIIKNDEKNKILFQQNKMAAMGEMIGNIAHQWRQPLSIITTVASSIKLKKELGILEDKDNLESLNHIVETANYLSNTIDDFQYYFSPNKNIATFNTQELINKSFKLVGISFEEKNINIVTNIENINVCTYENELLQVIINILTNAKDELSKNDLLQNNKYVFVDLYKENKNLIIKIKDNAGGVKDEIIDRIFEPYFTTKHRSKGTGIGLYMCEEIIVKHIKGTLKVFNEKYKYNEEEFIGAVFEIIIPL
jgi:signal transduction histidine kinase